MTALQHWIFSLKRRLISTWSLARCAQLIQSLCVLVVCACAPADAQAQRLQQALPQPSSQAKTPEAAKSAEQSNDTEPAKKLAEARAELQRIDSPIAGAEIPAGVGQNELFARRIMLERLVGVYARQVQDAEKLAAAERHREELEKEAREWNGFSEPAPYSVFLVDSLRSALQTATLQGESAQAQRSIAMQQMEAARGELEGAEESLRQIQERLERRGNAAQSGVLAWSKDQAQLRRRLAAATVAVSDAEAKIADVEIAGYRAQAQLLRKQLGIASSKMTFTEADLAKVLAELKRQQAPLEQELKQAQTRSDAAHRASNDAQSRLDRAQAAQSREVPKLADIAELRRIEAQNSDLAVDLARLKLDARTQGRTAWQYRLYLANSKDPDKLREAYAGIGAALARLSSWARYIDGEIALTTVQIDEQDRRVRAAASTDEIARLGEIQRAFERRSALYRDAKESVATLMNTLTLWKQQFDDERAARTFSSTVSDTLHSLRNAAGLIWNFELFNADDTVEVDGRKITAKRSVTVGKSIGAVLVLLLGYLATAWLMRRLELQLVHRFHVEASLAEILRRWGQFAVLAVLFVFALNLVKIPLTLFAFLGGALAIGVGFGAQNLLKNLMSGIILLIERPLRVGDIVEIGATLGSVTNISIRASTVLSSNGIETLIPNSNFLENVVTNWTYSDRRVRREIKIGVPRSASTRQVSELLLATAQRHGQLLKDPAPRVLLQDFAADTLTYSLQYWTEFRAGMDPDVVASDLRFMIETAFKEVGLSKTAPAEVNVSSAVPQKVM